MKVIYPLLAALSTCQNVRKPVVAYDVISLSMKAMSGQGHCIMQGDKRW
ncbi:hypothetical protein [Bacteroides pyogenes]|nr:hypothetical protein [Bacteroides pyogenes]MBR8705029.1 hypothetical protein [Bacteroides pyogenes]MBR8708666.1 hypothetical protein [Bacteroides pyogenes]MBR8717296.1 hypothetical protein [Bacteroides pyogenes]MBR8746926.1 hypothetical protein [Bacteroides pyogenes]MBR8757309.1 hypothetical protein [Bacteroides pyogenes]